MGNSSCPANSDVSGMSGRSIRKAHGEGFARKSLIWQGKFRKTFVYQAWVEAIFSAGLPSRYEGGRAGKRHRGNWDWEIREEEAWAGRERDGMILDAAAPIGVRLLK